jgi:hypothetical protein
MTYHSDPVPFWCPLDPAFEVTRTPRRRDIMVARWRTGQGLGLPRATSAEPSLGRRRGPRPVAISVCLVCTVTDGHPEAMCVDEVVTYGMPGSRHWIGRGDQRSCLGLLASWVWRVGGTRPMEP